MTAVARHLGRNIAQEVAPNLPPPRATTAPVARGGSWCGKMEAWGFPNNTKVRVQDLNTEAEQVLWLDILDYGTKNCGWKIRQPLVG